MSGEEIVALTKKHTLYEWSAQYTFYTNPPLTITEAQLREAFAIIDEGLALTDRAVKG